MNVRLLQFLLISFGIATIACIVWLMWLRSDHHMPPDAKMAVRVAEAEVRKRGWKRYKIENPRPFEGAWEIHVWELPAKPGTDAFVRVSTNGTLLQFQPGL